MKIPKHRPVPLHRHPGEWLALAGNVIKHQAHIDLHTIAIALATETGDAKAQVLLREALGHHQRWAGIDSEPVTLDEFPASKAPKAETPSPTPSSTVVTSANNAGEALRTVCALVAHKSFALAGPVCVTVIFEAIAPEAAPLSHAEPKPTGEPTE